MKSLSPKAIKNINKALMSNCDLYLQLKKGIDHNDLTEVLTVMHRMFVHLAKESHINLEDSKQYIVERFQRSVDKIVEQHVNTNPKYFYTFDSIYLNKHLPRINARLNLLGEFPLPKSHNQSQRVMRYEMGKDDVIDALAFSQRYGHSGAPKNLSTGLSPEEIEKMFNEAPVPQSLQEMVKEMQQRGRSVIQRPTLLNAFAVGPTVID